jgi:hypothetical protein
MKLESLNSGTVTTDEDSINHLANFVHGTKLKCDSVEIETSDGTIQITPYEGGLGIWEVDEND